MQLDRKMLQKLLSLDDRQLTDVIRSLAENSGLDLSEFHISPNDVSGLRSALSGATDEELLRATKQLNKTPRKGNERR